MKLLVVGSQADELRARLQGRLPSGVSAVYSVEAQGVSDADLDCEIAFGAPDALVPLLPRLRSLRWVQSTWAGVTPLIAAGRSDYVLTGVKGLFGEAMSEYVLAWTLALERGVLSHARARQWQRPPERGLSGLRLGIAGTGSIGVAVAARCVPFFREVVGLNSDGREVAPFARCFARDERELFAEGLDVLAMVLPRTDATDGLVDAAMLRRLARGALLINGGRANSLVLADALAALEGGGLAALVLDVLEQEPLPAMDPLWETPGVYITSHTAAPTDAGAISDLFLANLRRFLAGEPVEGQVDFRRGY